MKRSLVGGACGEVGQLRESSRDAVGKDAESFTEGGGECLIGMDLSDTRQVGDPRISHPVKV